MIHELRRYHVAPGRLADVVDRFRRYVPALFVRHGILMQGCWTLYDVAAPPTFLYLLAFGSLGQREESFRSFQADPQWLRVRADTNRGSEMVERRDVTFLRHLEGATAVLPPAESRELDQLVCQRVPIGHEARLLDELRASAERDSLKFCANLLWQGEALSGVRMPAYTSLLRWPNGMPKDASRLNSPRVVGTPAGRESGCPPVSSSDAPPETEFEWLVPVRF